MYISFIKFFVSLILLSVYLFANAQETDPLPSWNNTTVKKNILIFVKEVTDKNNANYISADKRIATFDNDGTLWLEQPIYTEALYMLNQIKLLAPKHPEWKSTEPFKSILTNDKEAIAHFSIQQFTQIVAATHSGMSTEAFQQSVMDWLKTTKNPKFDRPYTKLIYQPMLEVMQYLRKNDFKVYIVTGGGQDFVRAFAEKTYHVSPEKVIGSMSKTRYVHDTKKTELIKLPEILLIDDHSGKPIAINLFIGLKPIIAFGNSDGDKEMLEWTQSGQGKRLMLLVHHDDAEREYAYGPASKVGTFSQALMTAAQKNNWQVISMKKDWKQIFPN